MRPGNPIHPGEMLREEFLRPLGVSQREFAAKLHWTPAKLNELVRGKRNITAASALDLARVLKNSPELWMNLQVYFDLAEEESRRKKRA